MTTLKIRKFEKVVKFSYVVLKHEVRRGHLKWKIVDVCKEVGVSRGWAYKYYGKNKKEILYDSVKVMLTDILAISQEQKMQIQKKSIFHVAKESRHKILMYPEVVIFCTKHFQEKSIYGELIRKLHLEHIEQDIFKGKQLNNLFQAHFMRCILHGMATSFSMNDAQIDKMIQFIFSDELLHKIQTTSDWFATRTN